MRPAASGATQIRLRRASRSEQSLVQTLVQTVVDETYGGIWAPPPLKIDQEDWSLAWVAILQAEIAGVVLTDKDWVGDLWVLRPYRGAGVGARLLAQAEAEIAGRGFAAASLRLVSLNTLALAFYVRHGWQAQREYPHEHLPIRMIEMTKRL